MRQIQGKSVLLRVSGEFELPTVRVIGVQLYSGKGILRIDGICVSFFLEAISFSE